MLKSKNNGDSPFNSQERVTDFALVAITGGTSVLRNCGIEKTKSIVENMHVPVIGLKKTYFADGTVCITGTFQDVADLIATGTDIIAIYGTFRLRENELTGSEYIAEIKKKFANILIMADISTTEEALACKEARADCVSTTLCGYTPETKAESHYWPFDAELKYRAL